MRRMTAALLCGFACVEAIVSSGARAMNSTTFILENCDAAAYPAVSCELVLRNRQGEPVDDLQTGDVTVESGGAPARVLGLRRLADPAVRMHVTVLVDAGVSMRLLRALGDAATNVLDAIDAGDGLLWRVADAPPHTHAIENDLVAARAAAQAVRPDARARFYDALCEELGKLSSRNQVARMIVVIGDGRDAPAHPGRSSGCGLEDALLLARAEGVPILSVGVGATADHRALSRLAQASGGVYVTAGASVSADDIRHAVAQIARRQKARYRLLFDAVTPPALVERMVVVRVRAGADTLRAERSIVPMPAAPIVDWPELVAAGAPVAAQALPDGEQIRLTPRLLGRHIERVEYTLGAHTEAVGHAPFSMTLDTALLDPTVPAALKIRAYGSAQDMRLYGERVVLLAVADSAAAHALTQAGVGVNGAPARKASIPFTGAAGLAAAIALFGGAAIAFRARQPQVRRWRSTRVTAGALPGLPPARAGDDAQTLVRSVAALPDAQFGHSAPRTHVIEGAAAQAGAVSHVASSTLRLRVISGAHAGRDIVIPASAEGLVLGRAPHGSHAVTLPSAFLSAAHARFDTAGGLHVTDLNSSNGTRKNGERLSAHTRALLQPGDTVSLADVELRVVTV